MIWPVGVGDLASSSLSRSASIFVVIGVPSGSRFKGGSLSGCKFFLARLPDALGLASGVFMARPVVAESEASSSVALACGLVSESVSVLDLSRWISNGRLVLRGAEKFG